MMFVRFKRAHGGAPEAVQVRPERVVAVREGWALDDQDNIVADPNTSILVVEGWPYDDVLAVQGMADDVIRILEYQVEENRANRARALADVFRGMMESLREGGIL